MTEALIGLTTLLGVAAVAYGVVRLAMLPLILRAVRATENRWDDLLADRKVLNRISWLAPLVVLRVGLRPTLTRFDLEPWIDVAERLTGALLVLTGLFVLSAVMAVIDRIYSQLEVAQHRPIKGYLQVAMIVAWVLGAVMTIALLADQSIGVLVGGLGAFSAVVLLVFRDTILSLVASVQLTSNQMLKVGDWIEMPSQGADGDVIEVALHTVKVQNWDKTITTIPTYKLISDSFKNWRGMQEAGGRRIKRSIMLDISTIRFLTPSEIERWSRFAPLADYMDAKRSELEAWNRRQQPGPEMIGDPRRLTNIGTFRAYVSAYLRAHPRLLADSMTMLVRQLQPHEHGLPLEIYVFTATTAWDEYESIQADIFDHLLAMVPEFGLRVHQAPSGADIAQLSLPG